MELEKAVGDFIRAGGDIKTLPAGSEMARKYDEMRGLFYEAEDLSWSEKEKSMIQKIKDNPLLDIERLVTQ